jgi:hypothetical protein
MRPYKAVCSICGHIRYGISRKEAWDYMMRHCRETPNHPQAEPYLIPVTPFRYWLWKFNPDRGRLEQLERQAPAEARNRIGEYSP